MGGKGELSKVSKKKPPRTNLIPWPLLSHCPLHRHQCHCTCCCCCHCSCHCRPPPSWSWAWSWCSLLLLSHCFELHLFPPCEQLLAAVVMGVVGCSSLSCHCCCPPCLPGVSLFGHCCHALAIVIPLPLLVLSPSTHWCHLVMGPLIAVPSSCHCPVLIPILFLSSSSSSSSHPCFPLVIILLLFLVFWSSSHCRGPHHHHLPIVWPWSSSSGHPIVVPSCCPPPCPPPSCSPISTPRAVARSGGGSPSLSSLSPSCGGRYCH